MRRVQACPEPLPGTSAPSAALCVPAPSEARTRCRRCAGSSRRTCGGTGSEAIGDADLVTQAFQQAQRACAPRRQARHVGIPQISLNSAIWGMISSVLWQYRHSDPGCLAPPLPDRTLTMRLPMTSEFSDTQDLLYQTLPNRAKRGRMGHPLLRRARRRPDAEVTRPGTEPRAGVGSASAAGRAPSSRSIFGRGSCTACICRPRRPSSCRSQTT